MSTKENIYCSLFKSIKNISLFFRRDKPCAKPHFYRKVTQTFLEVFIVLLGKNNSWSQECNLLTRHYGFEGSTEGDLCLTISYVTADKSIHTLVAFHIGFDLFNTLQLVWSLSKWERSLEGYLPVIIFHEWISMPMLTLSIESYKLLSQLFGTFSRLLFLLRPAGGAH